MNDQTFEQKIQALGLTAPRVSLTDVEANIAHTYYFTAADAVLEDWEDRDKIPPSLELITFCVLVLKNGFTVTGESACVSPENFDAQIGREIAREKAMDKVWSLMGYALKQDLFKLSRVGTSGTSFDFGKALEYLREGRKVARAGWNGKGLWLEMQVPDPHSKMTLPYIYINYPDDASNTPGARVPWLASQTDMLATDWELI
jgi:hypothetical protein